MDDVSTTADVFLGSLSAVAQKPNKTTFLDRFLMALTAQAVDTKSPTAVGKFLGVNKQTADRWLKGGEPLPEMLYVIADKTKVNARWLARDDVPMTSPVELTAEETNTIVQIYRVLAKNPKALRRWLREGHELVEISTPVGAENPYGKA